MLVWCLLKQSGRLPHPMNFRETHVGIYEGSIESILCLKLNSGEEFVGKYNAALTFNSTALLISKQGYNGMT